MLCVCLHWLTCSLSLLANHAMHCLWAVMAMVIVGMVGVGTLVEAVVFVGTGLSAGVAIAAVAGFVAVAVALGSAAGNVAVAGTVTGPVWISGCHILGNSVPLYLGSDIPGISNCPCLSIHALILVL